MCDNELLCTVIAAWLNTFLDNRVNIGIMHTRLHSSLLDPLYIVVQIVVLLWLSEANVTQTRCTVLMT